MTTLPKTQRSLRRRALIAARDQDTGRLTLYQTLDELGARFLWNAPITATEFLRAYVVGGRLLVVRFDDAPASRGWELLTPLCNSLEIDLNLEALRRYAANER